MWEKFLKLHLLKLLTENSKIIAPAMASVLALVKT